MKKIILLICLLYSTVAWPLVKHLPGNVVVGTDENPDDSAAFSVITTTQGSLPCPRMTEVQRDAIASPLDGICIFNTDSGMEEIYYSGTWGSIGGISYIWQLLDVTLTATANNDILSYSTATQEWVNTPDLIVETNYTGTSSLDASAIMQVDSDAKGSIPCPKMTGAERDAIAAPTNGLCVYNTDTYQLNTYNSSKSLWVAAGDAGTTFEVAQTGHGRGTGQTFIPVYHNGTAWTDAQADATGTLATHVIINVVDANNFTVASSGRFEITAHGLAVGYQYTSAAAAGTLTVTEPTISNPIILVEDTDNLHILPWRASESTGALADTHTTYTPAGTTQTVDFNLGRSATVDLGSATGDVALTLSNPAVGSRQWIKFIQGATFRQLTFPSNVYFSGGVKIPLTERDDAIDVLDLRYDGSSYFASFTKNLIAFFLNTYSVLFDGVDEYANVPHVAALDFERTDAFSISVWIKTSTAGEIAIAKRDSSANLRGYSLSVGGSSEVVFALSSVNATSKIQVTSTSTVTDGNWHLVVVTYDGSSTAAGVSIYIDGSDDTEIITHNNLTSTTLNAVDLRLGGWQPGTFYYNGNLDEAAIWDTELTPSQANEIWNGGVPGAVDVHSAYTDLISWWRMGDSDVYPTLTDNKNSNDATMTNMEAGDIEADVP